MKHTAISSWPRALLALLALAMPLASAHAQNFIVPKECEEGVTGADGAYAGLPPLVSATYTTTGGNVQVPTSNLRQNEKTGDWAVDLYIENAFLTYLVVATYTPFLQSYDTFTFKGFGINSVVLPRPGYLQSGQYRLWPSVTITVMKALDSKEPMPGAFLDMAPDLPGSSPYTLEADAKGNVVIYCFTAWKDGNAASVFDAEHDYKYDVIYYGFKEDDSLRGGQGRSPGGRPSARGLNGGGR